MFSNFRAITAKKDELDSQEMVLASAPSTIPLVLQAAQRQFSKVSKVS